jgi:hypothetical protein
MLRVAELRATEIAIDWGMRDMINCKIEVVVVVFARARDPCTPHVKYLTEEFKMTSSIQQPSHFFEPLHRDLLRITEPQYS